MMQGQRMSPTYSLPALTAAPKDRRTESRWPMRDWKQCTIEGVASIAVPDGTTARLEEDGRMIVLTLPGAPPTEILMGLFPLDAGLVVSESLLRTRMRHFIDRCVRNVARLKAVNIEAAGDVDDAHLCVVQAVTEVEAEDRWWLARMYGQKAGFDFLLIHWNGPRLQMREVVLESFVSIEPLFTKTGESDPAGGR